MVKSFDSSSVVLDIGGGYRLTIYRSGFNLQGIDIEISREGERYYHVHQTLNLLDLYQKLEKIAPGSEQTEINFRF